MTDAPKKKKKKKKDTNFKPGNTIGKLGGRPPLPPELKDIKTKLSVDAFRKLVNKLFELPLADLKKHLENPKTNVMELMVGNIMYKAAKGGDHQRLGFILDRTIGKVKEVREIEVRSVKYVTNVSADGSLLQEIHAEESKSLPSPMSGEVLEAEKELINSEE